MNKKIRVERPEVSGWVEVPVDISCPKCRMLQRQVNNWRDVAQQLYDALRYEEETRTNELRDATTKNTLKRFMALGEFEAMNE
jgi:hypothetical protein